MKRELRYFDIAPKVVPANRESTLTLRPLDEHGRFADGQEYEISHILTEDTRTKPNTPFTGKYKAAARDNALRFTCFFEGEQEHVFTGVKPTTPPINERTAATAFRVYSVADDLLHRLPFKGDFHLHSNQSDGMESPAYVAASCRRIGLDFMAVTDHHKYQPSLDAIRAFDGVAHDLRLFPGEEIHPPDNGIHIINLGGRFSVNDLFKTEAYAREIRAMVPSLPPVPSGVDPLWAAGAFWAFDKIREAGGLAVFCHPYWVFYSHFSLAEAFIDYLFDNRRFDAYEVLGGFTLAEAEANILQVARYHDERAKGRHLPIVGLSDSHGCERGDLFGWYYTIVFSPSLELPDLIDSIKKGYSVAVEALPNEVVRPYGPFRLVKYALFLLREVLPLHDELCVEEGRLMIRQATGDADAAPALGRLSGRCAGLYSRLFPGCSPRRSN